VLDGKKECVSVENTSAQSACRAIGATTLSRIAMTLRPA
jgi:hypothetical protein